jgi:hypothetical protein
MYASHLCHIISASCLLHIGVSNLKRMKLKKIKPKQKELEIKNKVKKNKTLKQNKVKN